MQLQKTKWNLIFLLRKGDISRVIAKYFTGKTLVEVTRYCKGEKLYSNLSIFCTYLKRIHVLQVNIQDIIIKEKEMSYTLFLITRNKNNQLDFTEHSIKNIWDGNQITDHIHTIRPH